MDTGRISEGAGGSPDFVSSVSDKGGIRSVLDQNHIAYRGRPNHPRDRFFPPFFQRLTRSARPFATAWKAARGGGLADTAFGGENASPRVAFLPVSRARRQRHA